MTKCTWKIKFIAWQRIIRVHNAKEDSIKMLNNPKYTPRRFNVYSDPCLFNLRRAIDMSI